MNRTKIFWGIALISLSVLMLELSLTRLFSATMYYHFAFMAISLALFGSGASGVFLYIVQNRLPEAKTGKWLSIAAMVYSLSVVFALYVIFSNPLTLSDVSENYQRLVKVYLATSLPFFFAGCAITLAITRLAKDISRLYLFDLAGAALGCLLLIPVLNSIGAINTVLAVSAIAAVAAILFSISSQGNRGALSCAVILTLGLTAFAIYNTKTRKIDVRQSKGMEETRVLFSKWNSFSRITVEGDMDHHIEIKIDADAATGIVPDGSNVANHQYQRGSIAGLAYHLKPNANVAIIGPGGGYDVSTALVFDAKHITAVEINPIIARDVMSSPPFNQYNGGIYQHPKVQLEVDEGRSFIRRSADRYDVLQATMVDTWAATAAGAFSLTENNLYTVEAFKDYATHLTDDGVLTMTRWYFEPPDQLLRLLSLTRVMMQDLQITNPERHVMLVRDISSDSDRTPATYLFKKSEFTDTEVKQIEEIARLNNFQLLYTPLSQPDNVFTRMMKAPDPAEVWKNFETNVNPTYDNNPFFFNSIRLSNLSRALSGVGEWQKTNLGTFVLFALFAITTILVLLFIIGPLLFVRSRALTGEKQGRLSYLFYFACLGAGFIIVEVAMIQKFILFLGHPVYSLAVVLFSLLTFSALGSYLSGRLDETRSKQTLGKLIGTLIVLVFVYIVVLPPIFYGLVWLPHPARILIAVALMAPLAMVMGMPMPIGIKMLSKSAPQIIPWAWGVNGATSVMGSVGALVIAILTGFNQALIVGAGLYLLALLFSRKFRVADQTESGIQEALREPVSAKA
jgi:predicted membrane-bound spermidine synthase